MANHTLDDEDIFYQGIVVAKYPPSKRLKDFIERNPAVTFNRAPVFEFPKLGVLEGPARLIDEAIKANLAGPLQICFDARMHEEPI